MRRIVSMIIYNPELKISTTTIASSYSTKTCFTLSKNAAKNHANDGKGNHCHVAEQYCTKQECPEKTCPQLCDSSGDLKLRGHNTHKPPIGRFTRFVNEVDVNGDSKPQYFVPTNTKKVITDKEKQGYGTKIKPDPKTENYIKQHHDKYE